MAPIIEFDSVSKRFGGVRALQGVSFAVPGGEVHALVGENGSGKSTLIRICGGVFPPDEGTVRFEGREVSFADPLASRASRHQRRPPGDPNLPRPDRGAERPPRTRSPETGWAHRLGRSEPPS